VFFVGLGFAVAIHRATKKRPGKPGRFRETEAGL
jgi:hypothetical protein